MTGYYQILEDEFTEQQTIQIKILEANKVVLIQILNLIMICVNKIFLILGKKIVRK